MITATTIHSAVIRKHIIIQHMPNQSGRFMQVASNVCNSWISAEKDISFMDSIFFWGNLLLVKENENSGTKKVEQYVGPNASRRPRFRRERLRPFSWEYYILLNQNFETLKPVYTHMGGAAEFYFRPPVRVRPQELSALNTSVLEHCHQLLTRRWPQTYPALHSAPITLLTYATKIPSKFH